jgi:cobalt-zinc-cadmium efflux system protein
MESTPEGINPAAIEKDLYSIPGVKEVHDLHVWSVSAKKTALSVYLVAEDTCAALSEAHRLIQKNYNISHMTIQVEDPVHFQPKYCYDCDSSRGKGS